MIGLLLLPGLLTGGHADARTLERADAPPSAVDGLSVAVYSSTAAGLAWWRATDDRGVRGYEILRDGVSLGEVDALSYIVSDLVPGAPNRFAVVPVDTAGQRAAAVSDIVFATPARNEPNPRPGTPTPRASVYSRTAAGLAWTRPTGSGRIARYEVRRDGALVRTTRDASYIDTTLSGGRGYDYEIVAVDAKGYRSMPARITVRTPGGEGGVPSPAAPSPPLVEPPVADAPALDTVSNALIVALAGYRADAKVAEVRALAAEAAATAIASRAPADATTFPDGIGTDAAGIDVATTTAEHDCALGGRVSIGVARFAISEDTFVRRGVAEAFRFEDCRLAGADGGERVIDGSLSTLDDATSSRRLDTNRLAFDWRGFTLASEGTIRLEVDGTTVIRDESGWPARSSRTVSLARYVERGDGGALVQRLGDVELAWRESREGPLDAYELTLSGTVASPVTGGVAVTLETVTPFARRRRADLADGPYTLPSTGELGARAEDGRTLSVVARDADTASVRVDRRYEDAAGGVRETTDAPFAELTLFGPPD